MAASATFLTPPFDMHSSTACELTDTASTFGSQVRLVGRHSPLNGRGAITEAGAHGFSAPAANASRNSTAVECSSAAGIVTVRFTNARGAATEAASISRPRKYASPSADRQPSRSPSPRGLVECGARRMSGSGARPRNTNASFEGPALKRKRRIIPGFRFSEDVESCVEVNAQGVPRGPASSGPRSGAVLGSSWLHLCIVRDPCRRRKMRPSDAYAKARFAPKIPLRWKGLIAALKPPR
jgi:hypothetical protein